MAYPLVADVNAAIVVLQNAIKEDLTLSSSRPAYDSLQEAVSHLRKRATGLNYHLIVSVPHSGSGLNDPA